MNLPRVVLIQAYVSSWLLRIKVALFPSFISSLSCAILTTESSFIFIVIYEYGTPISERSHEGDLSAPFTVESVFVSASSCVGIV